jgi:hypothetical protein
MGKKVTAKKFVQSILRAFFESTVIAQSILIMVLARPASDGRQVASVARASG